MGKKLSIFILISIIVSSLFFINTGANTTAEECNDCPTPTEPGDAEYCKIKPLEFSSVPDEITCGTPVTIKITGGKGSFNWQVSGNGFTLNEINEREYSLSCIKDCACGDGINQAGAVAIVSVTDSCNPNKEVTKTIRNKSGSWVLIPSSPCSSSTVGTWAPYYYKIIDDHRWRMRVGKSESTQHRNTPCDCEATGACYPVCIDNYGDIDQNMDIWF